MRSSPSLAWVGSVLSAEGRDEAAERWLAGEGGPDNPLSKLAPDVCETCGFFVRLQGSLGTMFGAAPMPFRSPREPSSASTMAAAPIRMCWLTSARLTFPADLGHHRVGRTNLAFRLMRRVPSLQEVGE